MRSFSLSEQGLWIAKNRFLFNPEAVGKLINKGFGMREQDWNIRKAARNDIPTLVEFNCAIARETENKELNKQQVTGGVTRAFDQGGEVTYFVADRGGELLGTLMLTREWSDWRDGWLIWIQSVYIRLEYRNKGVFRSLLEHATAEIRANPDVVGLRLYVENNNEKAQRVYFRNGFVDAQYKVLEKMI